MSEADYFEQFVGDTPEPFQAGEWHGELATLNWLDMKVTDKKKITYRIMSDDTIIMDVEDA